MIDSGPSDSLLGYAPWNLAGGISHVGGPFPGRVDRRNCAWIRETFLGTVATLIVPALIITIVALEASWLFFDGVADFGPRDASIAGILSSTVCYLCCLDTAKRYWRRNCQSFHELYFICIWPALFSVLALVQALSFPRLVHIEREGWNAVQLIVLLEVLPVVTLWLMFQFYCFRQTFNRMNPCTDPDPPVGPASLSEPVGGL